MANTTNFNWETPDDTDLVKDGAAAIRTLGSSIDTSFVDLKGGTTGQILSKASNTDLDYTWIANDQGDITEVSAGTGISVASGTGPVPVVTNTVATTFDAKGDLVVGTGADTFAKLTVGTNGYTLVADSSTATGLAYAAPAAGALTLISTQTASDVATLTFDNVFSSTYTNYFLIYNGVRSTSAATTADLYFQLRYAGPTTQNATYTYALSGANSSGTAINVGGIIQGQMILLRNLGNSSYRMGGQMFIQDIGIGSTFPTATGQSADQWGEELLNYYWTQSTSRTYTGFIISTSSGNINGTFTLYGLAKS
jgi:hypothetical protein